MNASSKLTSLTLAFQSALRANFHELESSGNAMNLKITEAATDKDLMYVQQYLDKASEGEHSGRPRADIAADLAFDMAEIKSVIAARSGLTEQLAAYVDVSQTNQKTASQLEAAGAPHFAKVVRAARKQAKL